MQSQAVVEGIPINLLTLDQAVMAAAGRARDGRGFVLFTLNLDHLVKLRDDPAFRRAYARAELVSADGAPVVWLARRQGAAVERASGADMVEPLCAQADRDGLSLYVVGPGPEAQSRAIETLRARHPVLAVAGAETPMVPVGLDGFDVAALAERINASGARLCFLCLGAPKQELLAAALAPLCPSVGFLGVGAALDFIAGEVRRAPLWMQRSGLEWLWRLLSDPKRLTVRYARCAWLFAELALREFTRPRPAPAPSAPEAA